MSLRVQSRNGRRCGGPWATTDGTRRICTTTNIWHVVGRLGQAWKARVGTS
jgi:hypothetical protein